MTPRLFHESAGLSLVATVIARRLVVRMPYGEVYPNLLVLWLAPTTVFHKSTALEVARSLAHRLFPHLLAAQDTTPEALFSDMAGEDPANFETMSERDQEGWLTARNFAAQRGLFLDELSGLMSVAGKDYNAGLLEALLRMYDCDSESTYSRRGRGRFVVRNSYLNVLGASTPAALEVYLLQNRLWSTGWWPRFTLLTPEQERPAWQVPHEVDEPPELPEGLLRLLADLPAAKWPDPPNPISVILGEGVFEDWQRYNKAISYDLVTTDLDDRLAGSYGRFPTMVIKVATILAAIGWRDVKETPEIKTGDLVKAIGIVEEWRASTHRVLARATATGYERLGTRLRHVLESADGRGMTFRDICKRMRDVKPGRMRELLGEMCSSGEVEPVKGAPGARGGQPGDRYRLARE